MKWIIGIPLAKLGVVLYRPAVAKGYGTDYNQFTFLEKVGHKLLMFGLDLIGITTKEDVARITTFTK